MIFESSCEKEHPAIYMVLAGFEDIRTLDPEKIADILHASVERFMYDLRDAGPDAEVPFEKHDVEKFNISRSFSCEVPLASWKEYQR